MNSQRISRVLSFILAGGLALCASLAAPEDIDIFTVDSGSNVQNPNVLFVLDNSANWSRQSQQWPGGATQGEDETEAIKTVINTLNPNVNIGLMEYVTGGNASDADSGFVRFHIRPMTTTNRQLLSDALDTIHANINSPAEKRPQSNPFGNLFWDVYNYLAGVDHSNGGTGTPSSADPRGYLTQYSKFRSPLISDDSCRRTVVIFIANNVSAGPTPDSTANVNALSALAGGGSAGAAATAQIPFADYAVTTTARTVNTGYSSCVSSAAACTSAMNTVTATGTACTDQGYTSCACSSSDFVACPSTHWSVAGSNTSSVTTTVSDNNPGVSTANQYTGGATSCSKNQPNGGCTTPAGTTTLTSANTPAAGQTTTTYTSYSGSCALGSRGDNCGAGGKSTWEPRATELVRTVVTSTASTTSSSPLGNSAACYNDAASCTAVNGGFSCPAGTYSGGCACTATAGTSGCAAGNTTQYQQTATFNVISANQLGTYHTAPSGPYMIDEWARFLHETGVPLPGGGGSRVQVTTYTVDVFNAQQDANQSALLFNAARISGGRYFQAKNKNAIIDDLKQILAEVQAVNSAFSSASLPVNATNRAQNENQVFIGVFKPDRQKRPEWFGNLKRYQLINVGAAIDLGDANGNAAINNNTGFITDCAVSFWTVDSGTYWQTPNTTDPKPISNCTTSANSKLSDSPDGPFVEKGAAAEVLRRGNDPAASPDSDGNFALNRTVYTVSTSQGANTTPLTFNTATSGLSSTLVNFTAGQDVRDEDIDSPAARALTEPRSTIHGDVVHSRPQPLNFGGSTGVVVFYGSNDGMFHAVKAGTGQELWSFVAPEHYSKLQRLYDNTPKVKYFGDTDATLQTKDYFFDGSTGVYQTFDSSGVSNKAYIFPSMHRGGNKVYALDVTTPTSPKFLWSHGCTTNGTGCDTGFSAMGQSWSLPNVALIKGYNSGTKPVVIFGGGYDTCDDDNSTTPCAASHGRGVYVVDAETGALVKFFDFSALTGVTARGVAADVALIDVNNDKLVDYAYAADTGGNVYRMDFIDTSKNALASTAWITSRVAYTNSGNRKFLFTPALVQATNDVIYLAIGSGDREHPLISQYPYTTPIENRFYVFKDSVADIDSTTSLNLDDASLMSDYTTDAGCSTAKVLPSSSKQGWFIKETASGVGEQTVTSAVIAAGFVFFSTNRPTAPDANACTNDLGEARGYFVNLLNASGAIGNTASCGGTRSSTFVGGGLPPSPVVATVPIGGELKTVVIGAVQKSGAPSSPIESQRVTPPISSKRTPIYWYKSSGEK